MGFFLILKRIFQNVIKDSLFAFTNYFFFGKKLFVENSNIWKINIISVELAKVYVGCNVYIFGGQKNWELKMKKWSVFWGVF
jgi:hypothetical protein